MTVVWRCGGRGAQLTEAEKDRESRTISVTWNERLAALTWLDLPILRASPRPTSE